MTRIWHIGMAVPDLERAQAELGEHYDVDGHVTFSLGGSFAVQLWQSIPGTPRLGHPSVPSTGDALLLNRGPCGVLNEPCDLPGPALPARPVPA